VVHDPSASNPGYSPGGYADWKQIAGYFDGDGSVIIKIRKFVLIFYLQWVDAYRPQLEQIFSFIRAGQEIPESIYPLPVQNAFSFRITRMQAVLSCAERMAPLAFKKRKELQVLIDYYHNKITGDEAVKVINEQVLSRCRSGRLLEVQLPHTHKDGKRLARRRSNLDDTQLGEIRSQYRSSRASSYTLAKKYGVSPTTIRNISKD
jgi:hypothetical protein